jgi:diguanylate cyclase (GGDEF)-like protein
MFKPKLSELLLASFKIEDYNPLQTKILLLNAMLFITVLANLFFGIFNLFFTQHYTLSFINVSILTLISYAIYVLREKQEYRRAAYIGNAAFFIGFIIIVLDQHGQNFTLIWTFFLTPFAIFTLGSSRGFHVAFTFIVTVLAISYTGIDIWQEGAWNAKSYLRYFIAQFVMLYVLFAIQNSSEKADEKIEQMRQNEKKQLKLYEKLSLTDALTSLYNRRFLKEIFPRQLYVAKQNAKLFTFFILDLDHFKHYNDTYGHHNGDKILEEIAQILKENLDHSDDYAFRLGGDEFAGILIGDKIEDIYNKINTIMNEEIKQLEQDSNPILTCSIGACIVDDFTYDFEEIYTLTDEALYQAKNAGRNQVVYSYKKV